MLDHLLFNSQKWFNISNNDNQITANGKRYVAFPPKVTFKDDYAVEKGAAPADKLLWSTNSNYYHSYKKAEQAKCIGTDGDYYILSELADYNINGDMDSPTTAAIKKDLLIENWGDKTSPSHLCQWIRSLLYPTREVA